MYITRPQVGQFPKAVGRMGIFVIIYTWSPLPNPHSIRYRKLYPILLARGISYQSRTITLTIANVSFPLHL